MRREPLEPRIDPRSPVQPGRSVAPYILIALIAAILVWTAQQYRIADTDSSDRRDATVERPQARSSEAAPSRGDVRTVFSADDYAIAAQAKGEEGTVQAQLAVDATGRVSSCKVVRSSGHASLDDATCSILQRRARFTPAMDAAGKPIASTVVTPPVKWQLEG